MTLKFNRVRAAAKIYVFAKFHQAAVHDLSWSQRKKTQTNTIQSVATARTVINAQINVSTTTDSYKQNTSSEHNDGTPRSEKEKKHTFYVQTSVDVKHNRLRIKTDIFHRLAEAFRETGSTGR